MAALLPLLASLTLASSGAHPSPTTTLVVNGELPAEQATRLARWYEAVGPARSSETFGELVVRAGMVQLGVPYYDAPPSAEPEALRIELGTFQCVSFVESSLAVASCVWAKTPTGTCFTSAVQELRYRGGVVDGYASRLHYFVEWLDERVQRNQAQLLTPGLGGKSVRERFDYISRQPGHYPALADPAVLRAVGEVERRLSAGSFFVVPKSAAGAAQRGLQTGDVIAFVGSKPGILVTHVGLAVRDSSGALHLLHASSHHKRVVHTRADVESYVTRRPERQGFMAVRPAPLARPATAAAAP